MTYILKVDDLVKHFVVERGPFFSGRKAVLHAVDGVSFGIRKGETFSIVGETGSGKTTIGRCILRLIEPTAGSICFEGKDILCLQKRDMQKLRRKMQIIFQDPYGSLNPRWTVKDILLLPLNVHEPEMNTHKKMEMVIQALERVGLQPASEFIDRHPHEFSGGQRQRIVIARALILNPDFVVADEPVSSLDVSVRGQILNLMKDLQAGLGIAYLLISHNLSVVRYLSDWIAVVYLGKIVELAARDDLYDSPQHPYVRALLSATPIPDVKTRRKRLILQGEIPSPINVPHGCRFHTRCPFRESECLENEPELELIGKGHLVACHEYSQIAEKLGT